MASRQLSTPWPLFVYGSLQRGQPAHRRFCKGATGIAEAGLWGRLYRLAEGYPALALPAGSILAQGSADPLGDATLARVTAISDPLSARPAGDWQWLRGQLLVLPDPARSLPRLDRYEEFRPGREGPYRRVLTAVRTSRGPHAAWTYCTPHPPAGGVRLRSGRWHWR